MTLAGRKRSHSGVLSGKSKRARISTPELLDDPATAFRAPENPEATLSGLPAELRLQIDSYLCDTTIIHVHNDGTDTGDKARFTWTPCRSPNPASPLLCANPKWSGMCPEEDRCTYKIYAPPEPVGFWALAASNKAFRNDTQEFFLSRSVVSIDFLDLRPWLDHLAESDPKRVESLRRITLAGPTSWRLSRAEIHLLTERLPNLEGMGFQFQDVIYRWVRSYCGNDIQVNQVAWKNWHVNRLKAFDRSTTITMEAIIWRKSHPRWSPNIP
ncbi:hypothetical protein EK21DRAFT_90812 [Setomelanomma holmii]|uniref:Uncharacterized protein n=1 Tax=Setomelanomma holmii TaxID=210430 RepID=A0A9P4H5X4_9PLEO|nr:hypothetical protein EK21DRAFT_90812 [Setomelanomma holmii]